MFKNSEHASDLGDLWDSPPAGPRPTKTDGSTEVAALACDGRPGSVVCFWLAASCGET